MGGVRFPEASRALSPEDRGQETWTGECTDSDLPSGAENVCVCVRLRVRVRCMCLPRDVCLSSIPLMPLTRRQNAYALITGCACLIVCLHKKARRRQCVLAYVCGCAYLFSGVCEKVDTFFFYKLKWKTFPKVGSKLHLFYPYPWSSG